MKKKYNVVAAIIKKDDLIFCCKRGPKGECAFKWEFPGGKIEPGETIDQAIIREIKEELNSDIKVLNNICTVEHEYNTFDIKITALECELISGNLELTEHVESIWVTKKELNELDFAEADKKIIKLLK